MIEGIMLGVIALIAAVMYFTFTNMFGKKPSPVDLDFAVSGGPSKKRPKKKVVKAAPITEKWDAPEPVEKGSKSKAKKVKDVDTFFDPVKQGETIVKSAVRAAQEDKQANTQQQLSQRQRNKLQAQGFVVEDKAGKKPRRTSSRDKVDAEETSKHHDLSPEAAERLLLLERIASGQRAIEIDGSGDRRGPRKDKKDEDTAAMDSKKGLDTETLRKKLDEQRDEKKRSERERTAVRGGRVAYMGTTAKKSTANAWSRATPASPPADDADAPAADEPTPVMEEAAPVADEPEA